MEEEKKEKEEKSFIDKLLFKPEEDERLTIFGMFWNACIVGIRFGVIASFIAGFLSIAQVVGFNIMKWEIKNSFGGVFGICTFIAISGVIGTLGLTLASAIDQNSAENCGNDRVIYFTEKK